ncbi:excalibur calcium-binding domain-containing protein [Streptomyces sp. NBC_00414]|uniref:excalibur calcium-binding domain-containing protein n=1 Tax=Streptomyces sp. NBC_00414 TaxID=2975739 RepID=UPI002E22D881
MSSPYTTPPAPQPSRTAPRWARKRYVLPALGLAFFLGIGAGAGTPDPADDTRTAAGTSHPTATVTTTVTVSPKAEPAPTVTETKTVKTKVTETVTAQPAVDTGSADNDDSGGDGTYYANCDAARAAGAAPVHLGEPGYARHLDRDGDGTGCDS